MQSILILIFLICLLPYIFGILSFWYGGNQAQSPQKDETNHLTQRGDQAVRAYAIRKDSFENLLLFLPAVWFALQMMIPLPIIHQLCAIYFLCRVLYAICYLKHWLILRWVMWFLAFCSCLVLFGLSIYFA